MSDDKRCGGKPDEPGKVRAGECRADSPRECFLHLTEDHVTDGAAWFHFEPCTGCGDCKPEPSGATYQKACDLVVEMRKAADEWDLSDGEECAGLAGTISWWLDAALREARKDAYTKFCKAGDESDSRLFDMYIARADKAEAQIARLRGAINDVLSPVMRGRWYDLLHEALRRDDSHD